MRISSNSQLTAEQAKSFGREVGKRRKEAGFSAKDFATIIDCSQSYLYSIECGYKRPSPQLAKRIANAFGCEVSDMIDSELNETPEERAEYGKKLFKARMDKGIKRSVIANALGIPTDVYMEFERGECSISPHQKNLLNKLLDIDKKIVTAPPCNRKRGRRCAARYP